MTSGLAHGGNTPIDFAYGIHTEVGNQCTAARVNGSVVPLNYKLHNGNLVEVATDPSGHPYKDWLDWAVTSRARNEIRRYLRTQQRRKSLRLGGELLERAMHDAGLSLARLLKNSEETERLLARFGSRKMEELYVHIGYGKLRAHHVVDFLVTGNANDEEEKAPPASIREGQIRRPSCARSPAAARTASCSTAWTTCWCATPSAATHCPATRLSAS